MENNKVIVVMVASVILSVACMGILVMLDTPIRESLIGPEGPQGIQGMQGEQGPLGVIGIQGESGESIVGPQGESGIQGLSGEQGSQGEKGTSGYFVAYSPVSEYTEISGIVNGDFSERDSHRAVGWYTQGRSGFYENSRALGQRPGGTTMKQDIVIEENQGLAFSVKSSGVRLMVYLDEFVLFYGDFRNTPDEWIRVVVANNPLAIGARQLYFVVLHGPEGPDIQLANVTLVEFTLQNILIHNFTQNIEFNISAGTEKTWEFLIPEYDIVWEAEINFSGTYVSMSHAWHRDEERVFVGSSGISLTYTGSADIIYYGRQEYLWGTITVDYYQDNADPNKIWVMSSIMTNLPTISRIDEVSLTEP